MHKNGFTLIELVIVIVLIGILATVAAPRFINVSSDANIAALGAMAGAIDTANKLVYSKAIIQGLHNEAATTVDLDGDGVGDVDTIYGYTSGSRSNGLSQVLGGALDQDWTWSTQFGDGIFYLTTADLAGTTGEYINRNPMLNSNCYISYVPATGAGELPSIELVTDGC